jgi:hypothetical protein
VTSNNILSPIEEMQLISLLIVRSRLHGRIAWIEYGFWLSREAIGGHSKVLKIF